MGNATMLLLILALNLISPTYSGVIECESQTGNSIKLVARFGEIAIVDVSDSIWRGWRKSDSLKGKLYRIHLSGCDWTTNDTGRPELPIYTFLVAIPRHKKVADFNYEEVLVDTTRISGFVFPFQKIKGHGQEQSFNFDGNLYSSTEVLPKKTINISNEYLYRNTSFVKGSYCPIKYKIKDGLLYCCKGSVKNLSHI